MSMCRQIVWAALVFIAVSVLVLGVRPLAAPDEPRYGIIAAEMAESGHWFALRMAGFHYYEKPPLGMWLMAASISLFGESAFAIRLPSAIATGFTALVAGWLAARITRRRELGPVAFLVQATTMGPMVMGGVASLDPIFTAFVAVTLGAFYGACTSLGRTCVLWLIVTGLAAGLAFLTKGLLGLAIPAVTALAFLSWQRRWLDLIRFPWIPLMIAAALIAPIALLVHQSEPKFWESFLLIEHFRRFAAPDSNQHSQPWWYLLAIFPIGALLWLLQWPRALRGLASVGLSHDGTRFCLCWIAAPLIALSFSKGKVPTYILPLYAPLAVLVTLGLVCAHESGRVVPGKGEQVGRFVLHLLAALAIVIAILGVEAVGLPPLWSSHSALRLVAIAFALIVWAEIDSLSWRARDTRLWLTRTATAPVAMFMMIPFLFPTAFVRQTQVPWAALEANEPALVSSRTLITTARLGHCVSWATGRRDILIVGGASEFDNELGMPEDRARIIDWSSAIARIKHGGGVALVVSAAEFEIANKSGGLPDPATSDVRGDLAIVIWE